MSNRAAKLCAHAGCPHLQPCPDHPKVAFAGSDRSKRLPKDWAKRRQRVLARQPICAECSSAPSTECDHIEPGDDHRYSNLQGLCTPCHKAKTQREAAAARAARN